jgi:hypothetical protein
MTTSRTAAVGNQAQCREAVQRATRTGESFDVALHSLRNGLREPPVKYQRRGGGGGRGESLDDLAAAGDKVRADAGTRKAPRSLGPTLWTTLSAGGLDDIGDLHRINPREIGRVVKMAQLDARQLQRGRDAVDKLNKLVSTKGLTKLQALTQLLQDAKLAQGVLVAAAKLSETLRVPQDEALSQMIALGL